jgi:aspartate/tyrosine/aromatic aminotransferase
VSSFDLMKPNDFSHRTLAEYHIYMAENSRISIAGLNPANVKYVAQSIAAALNQEE